MTPAPRIKILAIVYSSETIDELFVGMKLLEEII